MVPVNKLHYLGFSVTPHLARVARLASFDECERAAITKLQRCRQDTQDKLSFLRGQYNVHRPLESFWGILQSEEHSYKSIQFMIERECGFTADDPFNGNLPLTTVNVRDGERRSLPRQATHFFMRGMG